MTVLKITVRFNFKETSNLSVHIIIPILVALVDKYKISVFINLYLLDSASLGRISTETRNIKHTKL